MNLTRRQWLWLASAFGAAQIVRAPNAFAQEPLFLEVPPSASGINWVHENAMSPSRYLPEALGPGCAFLDFDNDGWMDIFLVNSGPSDFWKPPKPVRNALYKNNRDGTFTDVTEKAGVSGAYFGMGIAVGDYDNDGWPVDKSEGVVKDIVFLCGAKHRWGLPERLKDQDSGISP